MKNIKKIQEKCLLILDAFIDVCEKHNLNWFADSGTLLGAIRRQKMIAWDDDIDIIMPREDYNKLLKIGKKEFKPPFFFQTPETDSVWCLHPRIRLDDTTCILDFEHGGKHHQGIFIDIFCLDTVPEDKVQLEHEIGFLKALSKHTNLYNSRFTDERNNTIINTKEAFRVMNSVVEEIANNHSTSNLVANALLFRVSGCEHVVFSKDVYSNYLTIDFEGLRNKMRVPVGYINVLTAWYGSEWFIEKQVPSWHSLSLYDTEKSYLEYLDLSYEQFKKLCTF